MTQASIKIAHTVPLLTVHDLYVLELLKTQVSVIGRYGRLVIFQSKFESLLMEVDFVRNDLINCLNNLDDWAKPEKASICIFFTSVSFTLNPCKKDGQILTTLNCTVYSVKMLQKISENISH